MNIIVLGGKAAPEKQALLIAALEKAGLDIHQNADDNEGGVDSICLLIHTGPTDQQELTGDLLSEFNVNGNIDSNRLVNVLFHRVSPDEQSANSEYIDLVQWQGEQEYLHFQELLTAIRQIQNEASHQAKKPNSSPIWIIAFLKRHKVGALIFAFISFIVIALFQSVISVETACSINFAQPTISDMCGKWGLGDKPTKTERLAWEKVDLTNCEALQTHARRFPEGAFRSQAIDLFEAGRVDIQTRWEPTRRESPLFEPEAEDGSESEKVARAQLLTRVARQATQHCTGYTAGNTHRVISSSSRVQALKCSQSGGKFYCEFDGFAVCELERRVDEEVRICGEQ